MIDRNIGWECPKCGDGLAPTVEVCPCNKQMIQARFDADYAAFNAQKAKDRP